MKGNTEYFRKRYPDISEERFVELCKIFEESSFKPVEFFNYCYLIFERNDDFEFYGSPSDCMSYIIDVLQPDKIEISEFKMFDSGHMALWTNGGAA